MLSVINQVLKQHRNIASQLISLEHEITVTSVWFFGSPWGICAVPLPDCLFVGSFCDQTARGIYIHIAVSFCVYLPPDFSFFNDSCYIGAEPTVMISF